jgi:O-antigen/teichoic acid export membrane protein
MVGALVYPLLAFVFAFAGEIVTTIYTTAYADAAPVMRLYIVGLAALVIELASITLLLRQGAFMLRMNLVVLVLSVALSWYAAQRFGFVGAAAGSVTVSFFDRIATLRRIALLTDVPFRSLQDWRTLGLTILFAALSAALAWGLVGRFFAANGPLIHLTVGAMVLAIAYGTMQTLFGVGRPRLAAAGNPEH